MTDLTDRNKQWLSENFDAAVSAFDEPDKYDKEWLKNLYNALIYEAKKSIELHQEQLVHLSKMQDKYKTDLETWELVWINMNLAKELIKLETRNIADYRETIKHGNR